MALGSLYRVVQDVQGNIVTDVLGTVTIAGTSTLASLFSDAAGTAPLPNPLVNNPVYGSYQVYIGAGLYDMSFLKPGYTFQTQYSIPLRDPAAGINILSGTPNQVIVTPPAGIGDVTLSTPQNIDPDATLQFAHLGLGTPGQAGYGLVVQTASNFVGHMTAATLTASGPIVARSFTVQNPAGNDIYAYYSALMAAGGTTRWQLWMGGDAPSLLGGTLQVNGALGLGGAAVAGHALTTYYGSQFAANVTVGMVGTAASTTLDVNGGIRARTSLQVDAGATITGTTTTTTLNATNIQGWYLGAQGAPDARYALRCYGVASFDGLVNLGVEGGHKLNVSGNVYITNSVGIGRGPEGGWSLTTNGGHLSYGAIQGNSTLYIATTGTFLGNVAICSTNLSTYQLFVNGSAGKVGGGSWADVSSRHLKRDIAAIPDALEVLLAQRGRCYEWDEPAHAAALPGPQYGFVYDEVTIPQWREETPDGAEVLTVRGFEALTVEALRQIVARLDRLESGPALAPQ